jgi:protein-S-isoprenylcysteine O-methyltransferase Ste14|tara:strand:+ start:614 stop:1027 length:414 start_codon:yes stop_codon:yes gene_type:complete
MVIIGLIIQIPISKYIPLVTFDSQSILGSIIIMLGLLGIIYLIRIFKANETDILPDGEPTILMRSGPYLYSRNPIYFFMIIILLGSSLIHGTVSTFLIPILFAIIVNALWINLEEERLESIFGDEYLQYKRSVRKWI